MDFRWLKQVMPRSLYGRAALILLFPIVMLQLVVSVAFIQRHFADVTRQMSQGVAAEIRLILDRLPEGRAAAGEIAEALEFTLIDPAPPVPGADGRLIYDFAGRVVESSLREELPGLRGIAFNRVRSLQIWLDNGDQVIALEFPRRRVSASNPHQLLVLMVVSGAVMTFIAYLFLRNQLRPIARLARAAEEFGKGRIVPYRPSGAIEVRAAGTAFLEMRNRIERQVQARNLMLSGVSHDLRSPLTRMKLGLSMIDDPEAEALGRDVEEMGRMVDAFLDFARGDAGDEMELVDAVALVADVIEAAGRRGAPVEFLPVEGTAQPIRLKPLAIRRALDNLIGNAIRHGSRVAVGLAFGERTLRLSVEDDGPGIPADRREEALRPFVRLDSARNQDHGAGVGLGLSIVADTARAHGGSLRLGQSERLGGLRVDLVILR